MNTHKKKGKKFSHISWKHEIFTNVSAKDKLRCSIFNDIKSNVNTLTIQICETKKAGGNILS